MSKLGLPEQYSADRKAQFSDALVDQMEANGNFMLSCHEDEDYDEYAQLLPNMAAEQGYQLDMSDGTAGDSSSASDDEVIASSTDGPTMELHSKRSLLSILKRIKQPQLCRSIKVNSLSNSLTLGFKPWEHHEGASQYVKNLDRKLVLPTWGMMYCGGAKLMQKDIKNLSDEYGIDAHIESFRW